jgi:hypothetical protein
MPVTLDQLLALAGRLDDSRDFDAARERSAGSFASM